MMPKIYSLVATLLLYGACATTGHHQRSTNVEAWMLNAFEACLDAQLAIKSPLWDARAKRPSEGKVADYVVDFISIPKTSFYSMQIGLIDVYVDGSASTCRLDAKTHTVLKAAYHLGVHITEVVFFEHDPLAGIEEEELDSLVEKGEIKAVLLNEFYK